MAVIGELAVNVVARTEKLTKGLKASRKQIGGLSKGFQDATKMVSGFVAAAIGGVGIYAIVRGLGAAAAAIDKLAKTSQKLGIATEELAGLQVAADRTGLSMASLETGLQSMVRRTSEAAQGTGQAVDALAELGVNARSLNQLAPEKQFQQIAQAMSGVANQADKVRLAYDLFGRSGVDLVRTLDLGRAGLKAYRMEAERLGLAVSAEEAAKVEKFNDALAALKELKGGIGKAIIIKLAPGLQGTLEGILQLVAPEQHKDALGPTLTGVKSEGYIGPNIRSIMASLRGLTGSKQPGRTDIRTEGVPIRPGELMSPAEARRLITVNEWQLQQARSADAALLQAVKEQQDKIDVDPFDVVMIP